MRNIFYNILLVILAPCILHAEPNNLSVSGNIESLSSITISGADFGSHALQVESLQANIESGTVGNQLSASGWSVDIGGATTSPPIYASDRAHSGGKSLKIGPYTSYNGGFVSALAHPVLAGGRFYASWWVYYAGETDGQWKMMRVTKNLTVMDGWYQTLASNWFGYQRYIVVDPGTSNGTIHWSGSAAFPQANGWYRVETEYIASSTGVADGVLTIRTTTPTGVINTDVNTNARTHYDSNASWNYALFQNYIGNGISNATIWYDDIYVQSGTHARVELCAGATWDNRGKCEVQVPTAWSSTSITATVNTGDFTTSSEAYLYVVDANGDANPLGVEVEIGGSGGTDTTPPVLSLLAPSGALAEGTTSTMLSFVTNEAALCRYSTSSGTDYASMTNNFSTALARSHSATVLGLENGGSYTYYVRCVDGSGNANTSDATISFSVASSAGTAGVLSWEYSTYSADRSDGRIPINIIRTGGSAGTVTAQWSSNGQTATHSVDYYGNDNVTVTFADGVTSVPINTYGSGENGIEMIANGATDDRYFQMFLSNPTGGATLGTTLATVTINGQPVVRGLRISAGAMPVGVGSTKITPIQ